MGIKWSFTGIDEKWTYFNKKQIYSDIYSYL